MLAYHQCVRPERPFASRSTARCGVLASAFLALLAAACGRVEEANRPDAGGGGGGRTTTPPHSIPNLDALAHLLDGGLLAEGGGRPQTDGGDLTDGGLIGDALPTDGMAVVPDGGPAVPLQCLPTPPGAGTPCVGYGSCQWSDSCGGQGISGSCESGRWRKTYFPGTCPDFDLPACALGGPCAALTGCLTEQALGCFTYYSCSAAGVLEQSGQTCLPF